jgi:hypothetical protein
LRVSARAIVTLSRATLHRLRIYLAIIFWERSESSSHIISMGSRELRNGELYTSLPFLLGLQQKERMMLNLDNELQRVEAEMNKAENDLITSGFSKDQWLLIRKYIASVILHNQLTTAKAYQDMSSAGPH